MQVYQSSYIICGTFESDFQTNDRVSKANSSQQIPREKKKKSRFKDWTQNWDVSFPSPKLPAAKLWATEIKQDC